SFLFFRPYFFKSSFSALMRSASHGWDGRSNFARENFGSPNDSLLLLRRFLLFRLRFLLGGGFLGLLGLRGLEGRLLRHPDREGVPDRPGPVQVRVRHPDNVAEVLFHALEFLRRPRGLRLFLRFLFLLRGAPRLLRRRGGGRAFGFGCGLLVRHRVP